MKSVTKQRTMRSGRPWRVLAALVVTLGVGLTAVADEPHRGGEQHFAGRGPEGRGPAEAFRGPGGGRGQILDNRYNHGGYYPARGAMVRELPGGYRPYFYHGAHYYFSGGVWYAPGPVGFRVVGAPIGLFVATLPAFYTTLWFGGVPYYYANDAYYQWQADQNGYVVVDTPPAADQPSAAPSGAGPAPAEDVYIYPKNGQTPEQQSADRFECHDWAKNQTGFDPTLSGGGVDPADNGSKREQYQRAMAACLEARGYSVK